MSGCQETSTSGWAQGGGCGCASHFLSSLTPVWHDSVFLQTVNACSRQATASVQFNALVVCSAGGLRMLLAGVLQALSWFAC
jgi:hypothetical protein